MRGCIGKTLTVRLLATTQEVSDAFHRYCADSATFRKWRGVPAPKDSRIIATVEVLRDDSASVFQFLEGAYDEIRSDGKPSGGAITLTLVGSDSIVTEARNSVGEVEWSGALTFTCQKARVVGNGSYSYKGRIDSGEHLVIFDLTAGTLDVAGRSTTGRATFKNTWRRRTS